MIVDYEKGNKCKGDTKILVTTDTKEPITIFKLMFLLNQLTLNELRIKEAGKWKRFLFEEAIDHAWKDALEAVDWADPKNELHIKEICNKVFLKFETDIKPLLRKYQQKRLREWI